MPPSWILIIIGAHCRYNNGLIAVQYLLPLMILSCAYYRVGAVLRKNQAVGDSRHAKSIAAKKKAGFSFLGRE